MHNVPNLLSAVSLSAGNTSGVLTKISTGTVYLAGGNNVTLSQNANSVTVSGKNAGAQLMSFWQNMGVNGSATDAMGQRRVLYDQPFVFQLDIGNNIFAGDMTVSTVLLDMTGSVNSSIGNYSLSAYFGLYTVNGGTQMSQINSGSVSFGTDAFTATVNHQSLINGRRYLTMNSSVFVSSLTMRQSLYYGALMFRSSSNSASLSLYGAIFGESGQRSGTFGAASVNNTYIGAMPYMGLFSATTTALPGSIGTQDLRKTALDDIFIPHIMFNNLQASF